MRDLTPLEEKLIAYLVEAAGLDSVVEVATKSVGAKRIAPEYRHITGDKFNSETPVGDGLTLGRLFPGLFR